MRVAYLVARGMLPEAEPRLPFASAFDQMMEALASPFASQGIALEPVAWDDPAVDWTSFAGALIGPAWDYWDRHEEFLSALEAIEDKTALFNSATVARWNSHKGYLRELEARGVASIPTHWLDAPEDSNVDHVFDVLGVDDIVFKRQVGAGAFGQHRVRRGDPVPSMPHAMFAQPFLTAILSEGEYAFIFVDGSLSHALRKRAAPDDYRVQGIHGGSEEAITPDVKDLRAAEAVLSELEGDPLYARVDMIRDDQGDLRLMEVELMEPFLYPGQGPELGSRLAAAVARRLEGSDGARRGSA